MTETKKHRFAFFLYLSSREQRHGTPSSSHCQIPNVYCDRFTPTYFFQWHEPNWGLTPIDFNFIYLRIFSVVLQQMRTNGWNQTTCWLWYTSSNECSQMLVSFSHGTFPPFHLHFAKRDVYLAHHHFIHMKYRNSTYISQQGTTPEYHRPSLRGELPSPDSYCNIRRSQWLWHC